MNAKRLEKSREHAQAAPETAAALAAEIAKPEPDWQRVGRLAKDLEAQGCHLRRTAKEMAS
jgi:hypothetical protein